MRRCRRKNSLITRNHVNTKRREEGGECYAGLGLNLPGLFFAFLVSNGCRKKNDGVEIEIPFCII